MRPDVVLISTYPPPGQTHAGHSGVASYTANLARALVDEGAEVAVVAPVEEEARSDHEDRGVFVRRVRAEGMSALPTLTTTALDMDPNVVHLQHETFLFGGMSAVAGLPAALGSLRRSGVGSAVTMHQVVPASRIDRDFTRLHRVRVPPTLARMAMSSLQNALANSFHRVIVHQETFADTVPGAVVIPHGIENAETFDRATARRALGLEHETRLVVLCFGFIAPYKGLELALEIADQVPDMKLVVAGGSHPRLGPSYARELRERWGSVAFFTGHVPDPQVPMWHAAADLALFCYPSPHASSGALALALAHGTPFLATSEMARCVDAPSVIEVPHRRDHLARRLGELAVNRDGLAELARASRELAGSHTWPNVAKRHLDLYEEVRNSHSATWRAIREGRSR